MLSALLALLARTFPRNLAADSVVTTTRFEKTPEEVWESLLLFEDVPYRPGGLLRWVLPSPTRTSGDMKRCGEVVLAIYERGYLERRITEVDPGRSLRFSVVTQRLGVEDCITMLGGSEQVRARGLGAELVLTSRYHGHLRPRCLARFAERRAAREVHAHVIEGITRKMESLPGRASPRDPLVPSWKEIRRDAHAEVRENGLEYPSATM
jgi:hypothetical protein